MSQQHQKWIDLVKKRLHERGWSQTDLAIVLGVTPAMVTRLLNEGHGSDDLKLKVNKKLRISESWTSLEE
ncbi:transcriptional regulator [Streptococcus cameli]